MLLLFTMMNKVLSLTIVFLFLFVAGSAILQPEHGVVRPPTAAVASGQNAVRYTFPSNYSTLVQWYQSLEANYSDYVEVFKAKGSRRS